MSHKAKGRSRTTFGATAPPFIDYLKDILRRYPDGGQILKELVQNADDAQATEVVFIHDERSYGSESLYTDELGKYQGPALYVYNNAAFTEDDWDGIQAAGRSVKRDDPNKVGRFGLGFNSVYHVTDVSSIFSSCYLGILDPQEKLFGRGNGGFLWSLEDTDHREALINLHDQFQPFKDILSLVNGPQWSKVIEDEYFDGTIFRFPLRLEPSDISDKLYDSKRVVELFDSFIADAHLSLLFLRHVTSVSLIHVHTDKSVHTRLKVTSATRPDVILRPDEESAVTGSTSFKSITLHHSEDSEETKWLVTTCCMKEGNIDNLDLLAEKLCFLPQVEVAFPCKGPSKGEESRLSCFLPLPNLTDESNRTGLPVSINACFGLTDNRRHIKWQEEDQKHDEAALWNELLIKNVLPQAYLLILQHAIRLSQMSMLPVSAVYDIWPNLALTQHKEKWHAVALDVLCQLFTENVAILSLAKDPRMFVTPSEAVLPCNGPTSPAVLAAIRRTLVSLQENLVTLPECVANAIEAAYPNPSTLTRVTPRLLRDVLHRTGVDNISKEDKLCLLEYMLSDGEYKQLRGLQLLPVSDGTFRSFTDQEEDTVLIDSVSFPRSLLPFCKHLFIPNDLSSACTAHLRNLAKISLFKVINLDKDKVADFARKHLPVEWSQTPTGNVTWEVGSSRHPPSAWLQQFWNFLNSHFKELSHFVGLPLIPLTPVQTSRTNVSLARLSKKTTLIFLETKQASLPGLIAQMVSRCGGTVVRGEEWLRHQDLDSFVLSPSPSSVVEVCLNLDCQHVIRQFQAASQTERENVKDYLSSLRSLRNQEKDLLLQLPLFETMRGLCVGAQSKRAVLLNSGLKVPTDLPMPDSVIRCATDADCRLLKLLGITPMDAAQAANLLVDCVERGLGEKDTQKIMKWILQHGNLLFSQNQTLKCRCTGLSFIDVKGDKRKASSLFDPRNQTFRAVFESDFFPPPVYAQTSEMLDSLTEIGLQNKETQVAPSHLLQVAKQIQGLTVDSPQQATSKAQSLLRMLGSYDLLSKFSQQELLALRGLKWLPCSNKEIQGHDWSRRNGLFLPEEVRASEYGDIVGYVMPLIGDVGAEVKTKLGFDRCPPHQKVLENLRVLELKSQTMADPDTDADFKRRLHSIYKHMQDHLSDFSRLISRDTPWLWNRSQFVSTQDLVLDYPPNLDLSSYIGKVPSEFLSFRNLLMDLGLRPSLSDEEIVAVLHSIRQDIDRRQQPYASASEVSVSIEILTWLWKEQKNPPEDIPVPVITNVGQFTLQPCSKAVFCDISKQGLRELQHDHEDVYVIHDEIPKAAAEWLNIPFLSTRILSPELVGIEQCGQMEPITLRIKNILKEYDEESDIFKELIQNSEDAGANTCGFLVDFREHQHPPESLIDPQMTLCQGPCLWAYNNEQFNAEDWKNIVRVGAATKENKVEKIGRFGLGFNTVYHITDIPSILSGESLLILDPNVTHLKTHIKHRGNPGIKLDLSLQRHFKCFPGQFGPYEKIFGCNFTGHSSPRPYAGTLIKLPFRTPAEALHSEICKKVYDQQLIQTFQRHLTDNSCTHLLFLKKISTLSMESISKFASTPLRDDQINTVMTVSKTVVSTHAIPDSERISQQRKAEKSLTQLDGKCKEVIDCCIASIVKIHSRQHGQSEVQSWLLYNCFGTDSSLKMAQSRHAKFSLPIGGVAVPLQHDHKTDKFQPSPNKHSGKAFCFLPLSIFTGLPVHVNGTFAVTSNRKGLWESGVKLEWNKSLLQDPVANAYVAALLVLKDMYERKQLENYCYHTFWPNHEKVRHIFKPLVDAFYSAVVQSTGLELFSDGKHWCSMNNAIFLHHSIEEDGSNAELAMQMCQQYITAPNLIVSLPLWLRKALTQADLEDSLQRRTLNWDRFYKDIVFKNLTTINPKSRDTLVLKAIDLNNGEIDNLIVRYPCIPTTGGQLQYIEKLVNPSGRVACLFEPSEGRLLGGTQSDFHCVKRVQRLLELGMVNDHLSLEDIAEKASKIGTIWSTDNKKAYIHLRRLLELMAEHMHEESACWDKLRETTFLPAFAPGDVRMKGEVTLQKPVDIFNEKCCQLVSMTKPVMDHSNLKMHNANPVLQFLGVHENPDPEMVIQQLHKASQQSQGFDKDMLHRMAQECYRFLNERLRSPGQTNHAMISKTANSFPFILVGNDFVHVNTVAENEQFEAKPYLHVLPRALADFRTLWECVGVERNFTFHHFNYVLQKLHGIHGSRPLPKSDLKICLTVLMEGICEAAGSTAEACLVPDDQRVLKSAHQLHFNDSPWMPVSQEFTLCHRDIPRNKAVHLGIKTIRHQTLENLVVENGSPFAFLFEQKEQLAVRIKNIISAYPAKKDILKELMQNADDAEATEIHFVWDQRQHGTKRIFGDRWNQLQGPALCVYNNKVFSDDDLRGIQQLGEGGKQNAPAKTGKYGVGFNSVYHLTDCPAILTGDKLLCISDPNQKYIERHSEKPQSGIGYQLKGVFKELYSDVYKSFLPDDFSLEQGTMFRLPLRTAAMANNSKISPHAVTEEDMRQLREVLSEDPEGFILFLKNIRKMAFHEISREPGELKTIFQVEKSLQGGNSDKKAAFQNHLQKALLSGKVPSAQKTIYQVDISTSDAKQSKWLVAEQLGSFKVSSELNPSGKFPQAAVAACVHCKPPRLQEFNGEAFCSLPLPGKTGLPVHINGNFEVDSSRKNLWKEDGQSLKLKWNESLKQQVIAPLYADVLHYIRRNFQKIKARHSGIETCLRDYYLCFFPAVSKKVSQEWHEMIHEVYRSIHERALDLIPVLKSEKMSGYEMVTETSYDWCSTRETGSADAPHLVEIPGGSVNRILEDLGMKLVPSAVKKVWDSFQSAGIRVRSASPAAVRNFLRENDMKVPQQITATPVQNRERCSQLLAFCLKDLRREHAPKDIAGAVDGLPLLLTQDQVLNVFNSSCPIFISRYHTLFLGFEGKFADFLTNMDHVEILRTGNLVTTLTLPNAVKYLKPLHLQLLQACQVDKQTQLHVPNEKFTKWLEELWRFFIREVDPVSSIKAEGERLTMTHVRQLFEDCHVLPVVCPRQSNRQLLQKMKEMPSVIYLSSEEDTSRILFKLGFMKLDLKFFLHMDRQIHSVLQPELMNTNSKNSVMDNLCKIDQSEFSALSNEDMKELQSFLQVGITRAMVDYCRKLKSLPLFQTVHGNRIRIDGSQKVFILNVSRLESFPDLVSLPSSSSSSIFLKNSNENMSISNMLNIQILDDLDYFLQFLLPTLNTLSEKQLLHCIHLLLLMDGMMKYHNSEDTIISSMKMVNLICSCQGKLEKASYFFDKSVELYEVMVPQERFVPEQFWRVFRESIPSLLMKAESLLQKLGMKHEVSRDEVISFARQIESDAKTRRKLDELKKKSSTLLKTVVHLESCDEKGELKLLESIADIKFIFPVKIQQELCKYHKPYADESTAVAIRGSLLDSDRTKQKLIWTSMPIIHLAHFYSGTFLKKTKAAGAFNEPPSSSVTANMRNICQTECDSKKLLATRAEVFRSCYAHLQGNHFDSSHLAQHPVVLVEKDTKLVMPDDVCLALLHDLDLRPYLFKIQPADVIYESFFKKIGVNLQATAAQYRNVLAAVYADSKDKPSLNPNQRKTVWRAVEQLFLILKENQSQIEAGKPLYLPSVDGKLYPSSSLYFNNTAYRAERIEGAMREEAPLLENLKKCHLSGGMYEHQHLLELLPPAVRPKMLSECIEEKLVESDIERCEYITGCGFRGWFERHLSLPAFRHGLICVIRYESRGRTKLDSGNEMFQQTFGNIQIDCCENLRTQLWLEGRPLQGTNAEKEIYVKRSPDGCTFYLKHSDDMASKVINKLTMTLTNEINVLLGNRIQSQNLQALTQLLMCDNLEDVKETLAYFNIPDSVETENGPANAPLLGTPIPVEFHDCLDMSVINNFEEGEYVGVSLKDTYVYAVIVEELPGTSGLFTARYRIQIGEDEIIEVGSLDLYQFKRPKEPSEGTSTALQVVQGAMPQDSQTPTSTKAMPASLEEAKNEIDRYLAEVWMLPEDERKKAIKRLFLKWHPDKNPDCCLLATEAFKYIQQRLENPTATGSQAGTGRSSTSGRNSHGFNFQQFYEQWNNEARFHRRGREQFFSGFSRRSSRGSRSHSYNFWDHFQDIPRPDRAEAGRWCRQARCDLKAASKDSGEGSTEWCLFKVHQAVEKSLIAAEYRRTGRHPENTAISASAERVSRYNAQLSGLPQIVEMLKMLGVDAKKTQYPNCHRFPNIPNGQFRAENAREAIELASELLTRVEAYVK